MDTIKLDDWDAYYKKMIPWLTCEDHSVRASCLERLCTAVFWSESSGDSDKWPPEPPSVNHMVARIHWFIDQIETAHEVYDDVIPELLHIMVHQYPSDAPADAMTAWLKSLLKKPPVNVSVDRVLGNLVLNTNAQSESTEQSNYWLALLDDSSGFVRGCAASRLGMLETGLAGLSELQMFELIKEKEIQRPGVAGPFWSSRHHDFEPEPLDVSIWMMEIIEQRPYVPKFYDMPSNDIEFYLHEVCDYSPDIVERMIASGFLHLAIETATEERSMVDGMKSVLLTLGAQEDQQVCWRAWSHLCEFYRTAHPSAPINTLKHIENWQCQAEAFVVCKRNDKSWAEILTLYPLDEAKPFSDDVAWSMIDSVLPPDVRGSLQHTFRDDKSKPPEPIAFAKYKGVSRLFYTFKKQTAIQLEGDKENKYWTRIHLWSSRLGFFEEEIA